LQELAASGRIVLNKFLGSLSYLTALVHEGPRLDGEILILLELLLVRAFNVGGEACIVGITANQNYQEKRPARDAGWKWTIQDRGHGMSSRI
jgi:hypothetical protein